LASLAAQLSDAQLRRFPVELRSRGVWLGSIFQDQMAASGGQLEILRAYSAVSPAQRARLGRGEPVRLGDLPLAAQRWLRKAFQRRGRLGWGRPVPSPEPGDFLSLSFGELGRTGDEVSRG